MQTRLLYRNINMGMVVSAAVTGIPVIEELERPNPKKPVGEKQGNRKRNNVVIKDPNPPQEKRKQIENAPPNSKSGTSKESKPIGPRSGNTTQIKGRSSGKEEVKSARSRSNTTSGGQKGVAKPEKATGSSLKVVTKGKR